MGNDFSFSELTRIVTKNFKFIAAIGVIAAICAVIFSSETFIKPRYKSTAVVYPSNLSPYSEESRTEQLQQLFESSDIRDSLINRYGLYSHYEIDSTAASSRFYVINEFNSRVVIKKTKFESVEFAVEDEDPELAFKMARDLIDLVNAKARNLQRAKSQELVEMTKREVEEQLVRLDSLDRRLNALRKEKGLLEYEMQTQEATKGLFRLAAEGKTGSADYQKAKQILDNLVEHGGEFKTLYEQAELANEYFNKIMEDHQVAINDVRKDLTYINTVVYPEQADKKHYPVRWLIVFTAVFSSVLFSIVVFLFTEKRTLGNSAA